MQNRKWLIIILFILASMLSFFLGYQLKTFLYEDACLDLGGSIHPNSQLCLMNPVNTMHQQTQTI